MSDEINSRLKLAREIAREAGELTLDFFQQAIEVERKGDDSPVTQADQQAEQLMRKRIAACFPNDAIVGEEFGEQEGTSGFQWILDPIDGTKSFIAGVPLYSVLVAVVQDDSALIGMIAIPALNEFIYAAKGQGAWWVQGDSQPQPARVSNRQHLSDGIFVTSQVDGFDDGHRSEAYRRLERAAYITRSWGDGYGYLLVATGRVEVMVDPEMNVWDAAALQTVLEEAGGTFTDWQGQPGFRAGEGVATNGHVLKEVLAITCDYPKTRRRS